MPRLKYQKTCTECGNKITAYTLPMTAPLMKAFAVFAKRYLELKVPLKKGVIGLTNAQYSNFQNLRHFGLIAQAGGKGAAWVLTKYGYSFFRGELGVLSPAGHMGGETLTEYHEAWKTLEGHRKLIFISDELRMEQKQRAEYQREKGRENDLFES